ncbi:MAG: CpsD/CapB family tyrosine-protein kinase, partial [Acidimicrobiales bacterium]
ALAAQSQSLQEAALQRLGADRSKVNSFIVAGLASTDAIQITAFSTNRNVAAQAAQAYADTYIDSARASAGARAALDAKGFREQAETLTSQIAGLDEQIIEGSPANSVRIINGRPVNTDTAPAVLVLQNQRDALGQRLASLLNDAARTDASSAGRQSAIAVVKAPEAPKRPLQPLTLRNVVIGGALGLLLGLALALLRHRADDRLRTSDDVAHAARDLRMVLGIPPLGRRVGSPVEVAARPGRVSEALRLLRFEVLLSAGAQPNSLLVTSAQQSEGKTTLAALLAVALAQTGVRVVLVDADLRHPRLEQVFGLKANRGLSDLLTHGGPIDCAQRVSVPGGVLDVITAGVPPANPSELLLAPTTARLLADLKQRYEHVIIDSPPLLAVADSSTLAQLADSALLVARAGKSDARSVEAAVDRLKRVPASMLGVVLVGVATDRTPNKYYLSPTIHEQPPGHVAGVEWPKVASVDPVSAFGTGTDGSDGFELRPVRRNGARGRGLFPRSRRLDG